jgi:alpha-beta hydrolase superfamily lysophospholipase
MKKVFNTVSVLLLLAGATVAILPTVVMPDLIYPQRVDSAYIAFHHNNGNGDSSELYFNPSDIGLAYQNIAAKTIDSVLLKGWYIPLSDSEASTLVIIHDINESKIKYLNLAKQMHDRGLKVCLFDMRAHGTSGGEKFSPGLIAADDLKSVLDMLYTMPETNHIVLMGVGIGAGVALQEAALDERCEAVILQCPYNDFADYVQRYAQNEWKRMRKVYTPVLERKLYMLLHHPDNKLVLSDISSYLPTPSFFIAADNDSITPASEARTIFDSSMAEKKDFILVQNAGHDNIEIAGGEAYYNSISEFINQSIPKKVKKVRYKKLT